MTEVVEVSQAVTAVTDPVVEAPVPVFHISPRSCFTPTPVVFIGVGDYHERYLSYLKTSVFQGVLHAAGSAIPEPHASFVMKKYWAAVMASGASTANLRIHPTLAIYSLKLLVDVAELISRGQDWNILFHEPSEKLKKIRLKEAVASLVEDNKDFLLELSALFQPPKAEPAVVEIPEAIKEAVVEVPVVTDGGSVQAISE